MKKRKLLFTIAALLCSAATWATDYTGSLPAYGANWDFTASGPWQGQNIELTAPQGQCADMAGYKFAEVYYNQTSGTVFEIYKTISVPNGTYIFQMAAFGRRANDIWNGDNVDTAEGINGEVFANDATVAVTSNTFVYYTVTTRVTNGSLKVGLRAKDGNKPNWWGYTDYALIKVDGETNVDLTKLLVNPSFECGNTTGWTLGNGEGAVDTGARENTGNYETTNTDGTYLFNTWWQGVPITQTIVNMPNGQYKLTTALASSDSNDDAKLYLLGQDNHSDLITITRGTSGIFNDYIYTFNVANNSVTIGAVGGNADGTYNAGGHWWYKADNFRLEFSATIGDEAVELPTSGAVDANQWHSVFIPTAGNYNITSPSAADIAYSQDGTALSNSVSPISFSEGETKSIALSAGTLYIKSSVAQSIAIDMRFYLTTEVGGETKWLNKNESGITYVSSKGLPFTLELSGGYHQLKFSTGNYLNDAGANWETKIEGSNNNDWILTPVEDGYKIKLRQNTSCELFVSNTSTGFVEISHDVVAKSNNVWQFVQPETALASAITDAETHTLGFEDGKYAPYTNVEGITALASAKAATTNDQRINAYAALTDASWTINAGEMNAIYDGDFNLQAEHTTSPTTLNGWTSVEGIRQLIKNTETYPGLASASNNAGVFSWGGTALVYGETTGYTLPLAEYTIYDLTLKIAGWLDGDLPTWLSASVLNSSDGMASMNILTTSVTKRINETEPFITCSVKFVTGAAGNYVLTLQPNKHNVITDLELKKAVNQYLEFADNAAMPTYAPGTYPSVKISRTLTANRWATAIYPFAVSGVNDIAVLNSYDASTGALGFTSADASTANEPFLMRSTAGTTEISLSNVEVAAASATDAVVNKVAYLKGTYTSTDITNEEKNYVLSNNKIYSVGEAVATINPYRAYIQIASSAPVKALNFFVDGDDDATGISTIDNGQLTIDNEIYNLAGQRMSKMQKGINIVNGKKVLF